jgi:hypothetical protein
MEIAINKIKHQAVRNHQMTSKRQSPVIFALYPWLSTRTTGLLTGLLICLYLRCEYTPDPIGNDCIKFS